MLIQWLTCSDQLAERWWSTRWQVLIKQLIGAYQGADRCWSLITLQYCSGICHTLTWISHGCTCVPHPEPPSQLPPEPIPQGHPSAPALSALFHASNLDWSSISHMVIYTFQCYSLKSSHPHRLPQSLKVCSLLLCHLCPFCCLAYSYHISKFHIYVIIYWTGVFLSDLLHSV